MELRILTPTPHLSLLAQPRIGFIGVAGYAGRLLDSLLCVLENTPGVLSAATVIPPDSQRPETSRLREMGCEVFPDYRQMLRQTPGLDLCIIPTGIHWHSRMTLDALAAGAHVFLEKPLAGCVEDGRAIIQAARRTGKFVAVGFQDLFAPSTRHIQTYLKSGRLGGIKRIRALGSWPRGHWYYTRNDWAGRRQVGGWAANDSPLNNAFAHFLNLALHFADAPEAGLQDIRGQLLRCYPIETYDTAAVSFTTASGVRIECVFTHADPEELDPRIFIELEQGAVHWHLERQAFATTANGEIDAEWPLESAEENRQGVFRNVLSHLTNPGPLPCCAETALAHLQAVSEIEQALEVRSLPTTDDLWNYRPGLLEHLRATIDQESRSRQIG